VFSLLGGIAAAMGIGGVVTKAAASSPNKYIARMNEIRAAREAAPAAYLGNAAKRGVNGLCLEHHPAIYGDGVRDDEPGFTSILACGQRGHRVELPAHRIYRLHKPLNGVGSIELVDAGVRRQWIAASDPALTKPLQDGYARLFWVEGATEMHPENFRVVDIPA
jgi:hypothetical protein